MDVADTLTTTSNGGDEEKKRKFTITSPGMSLDLEELQTMPHFEEDEDEEASNSNSDSQLEGITSSDEEEVDGDRIEPGNNQASTGTHHSSKLLNEKKQWEEIMRKDSAAGTIQAMVRHHASRKLFRFVLGLPDMFSKRFRNLAIKIQKNIRGYMARKLVKYLRGDFVKKPSLRMRIKATGGEYKFLKYVYKVEDERDALLMEVASLKSELLFLKPEASRNHDNHDVKRFIRSGRENEMETEKKWMLHRKVDQSKSWVEVGLSNHAERRLDALVSTSLLKKASKKEKEKMRRVKHLEKKRLEELRRREEDILLREKNVSPVKQVGEIEQRRGLVEAIEIELELEQEEEVGPEVEAEAEVVGVVEEKKLADGLPRLKPAPRPKTEKKVDVVAQWRMSRGY